MITVGKVLFTVCLYSPCSFTALDLAMLKGHAGCSDFLLYCHAPSGGGAYHRAALTIQSVWRLYRHKVCGISFTGYTYMYMIVCV